MRNCPFNCQVGKTHFRKLSSISLERSTVKGNLENVPQA